jgi:hypothetical protein
MKRLFVGALAVACLAMPRISAATDVWDQTSGHQDDNAGTDTELARGTEQVHDLQAVGGTQDQDWFLVGQQPYSSYEVIVDGLTEPVASIPATQTADPIQVDLVDSGGTLISSGYAFSSIGSARTLRFRNTTASEITNQYVRVMTGTDGCTTFCTANAQYRIQFRETTLLAPRYNNSATQITILVLQNASRDSVSGTARFWNASGTLVGSSGFTLATHATLVLNTSTVGGVAGTSGSITIDNDGPYGGLTGKAVALEPATGFTFDTLVVPKFN